MEKYVDNKDAIKSLLKQGKLVVSGRCTGKTEALVDLLREDPRAIVITPSEAGYRRLIDMYQEKYGDSESLKNRKVFRGSSQSTASMAGIIDPRSHDIYVDEFYINPYTGPFYAAVTSFPIPVVVL